MLRSLALFYTHARMRHNENFISSFFCISTLFHEPVERATWRTRCSESFSRLGGPVYACEQYVQKYQIRMHQ